METVVWRAGDWAWSDRHAQPCRILELADLWGARSARIWLPEKDEVARIGLDELTAPSERDGACRHHLIYAAAAARIADALHRGDVFAAPLESTVIPLPHQLHALSRALSGERIRYLLADEVGLGKTIEAGLIFRELKIRGRVRRVLVVAPMGLVTQWIQEMRAHFQEDFRLVVPGEFSSWRHLGGLDESDNLWKVHDQVVCPMDSVKPLDSRRGWSHEQVARYNRERFEDLVAAGWDLIVVDEAHRLGGSTEQVARYRLGQGLAQAAPYLLLLSATPHQGKTDGFRRLMRFLDNDAFPDEGSIHRNIVAPLVIRTEKRHAIDARGALLFKERRTQGVPIAWGEGREDQAALYEAVTEYVREGYNRAVRDRRNAVGFLMVLMQRLVSSSTAAIHAALARRLEVLELPEGQLSLFPEDVGEGWADLDGQAQMDTLLKSRLKALKGERAEVELLLSAARRCMARGSDVKAEALLEWLRRLEREESDPNLKALVFTEFVPTQGMLAQFLSDRGYSVTCLNGQMGLDERRDVQRAFREEARVLISTDAGGEGLNLQFCHVVVNYDLPWNPMKIEQRIGRVDRIGQDHVVRAFNFAFQDGVEMRVREVLEEKLQRILDEFGIDKLADVLDSEAAEVDFERLYVSAIVSPEKLLREAEEVAKAVRRQAQGEYEGARLLGEPARLDPGLAQQIAAHRLPFWTERMTLAYLRSHERQGAAAVRERGAWSLRWPDGFEHARVVFRQREVSEAEPLLSLEDAHARALVTGLPQAIPGGPVPSLRLPGISDKVSGTFSLWRVSLETPDLRHERILPVFRADDGRVLPPTARAVWDALIELEESSCAALEEETSSRAPGEAFETSRIAAEEQGRLLYEELVGVHRQHVAAERAKGIRAFEARRRAIERVGLPHVRAHRLGELERERADWQTRLSALERVVPALVPVLAVRIAAAGARHS